MRVIAKKTDGIAFMYGFSALLGGILLAIGIKGNGSENLFLGLAGVICVLLSGYHFVEYLRVPHEVIRADNNGILYLPGDVTLDPKDIVDVSYHRASAKGFQYRWGEVIIITHIESFKFDFIDDCEEVSKELTRMMYESKEIK